MTSLIRRFSWSLALGLLFLAGVIHGAEPDAAATFARWLPGTYSSEAEAKADPTRSDVRIRIVPLWTDAADGPWFYLEQAEVAKLAQPYRQAVLHVVAQPDGSVLNENWDLVDKATWIGAWKDPALLAKLTREAIKPGAVFTQFRRAPDGTFTGGTPADRTFANRYKGAATFTNVSILTATTLYSWDRGWKTDGTLAWGPADRGYLFTKIE